MINNKRRISLKLNNNIIKQKKKYKNLVLKKEKFKIIRIKFIFTKKNIKKTIYIYHKKIKKNIIK